MWDILCVVELIMSYYFWDQINTIPGLSYVRNTNTFWITAYSLCVYVPICGLFRLCVSLYHRRYLGLRQVTQALKSAEKKFTRTPEKGKQRKECREKISDRKSVV